MQAKIKENSRFAEHLNKYIANCNVENEEINGVNYYTNPTSAKRLADINRFKSILLKSIDLTLLSSV